MTDYLLVEALFLMPLLYWISLPRLWSMSAVTQVHFRYVPAQGHGNKPADK